MLLNFSVFLQKFEYFKISSVFKFPGPLPIPVIVESIHLKSFAIAIKEFLRAKFRLSWACMPSSPFQCLFNIMIRKIFNFIYSYFRVILLYEANMNKKKVSFKNFKLKKFEKLESVKDKNITKNINMIEKKKKI